MPAATEPVHKGTLVCVVLKARNLPNKKSIGKQDPYTVLSMGQEQQKTKPDKRGGQHPTWDEQLHFEVYEDMEDSLANPTSSSSSSSSNSASASKPTVAASNTKGGKKVLKLACYADDSKEPEFIGEGLVDLTETLNTGEFDEWVTIKAKDRYAGEVYLELTFYSSAAPPKQRKSPSKPVMSGSDTYGGAGTFQRIDQVHDSKSSASTSVGPAKPPKGNTDHPPIPSSMRPGGTGALPNPHDRMSSSFSTSSLASAMYRPASSMSHSQTIQDLGSATLRPSSSLANLDAYTPAYAPASISRSTSPVPPSSIYHSATLSNIPSSIGPTARASRRSSFAAPMPSDFGHSITPSASYYSQHSITPSQSNQYLANNHPVESSDDRYATIRPGATVQQPHPQPHHPQYTVPRSHSISYIPVAHNHMPQPDFGADQLAQSMFKMGFGHSTSASTVTLDKPLPPPTPSHVDERSPQSIYQAPAHLASLYTPPQELQRPASPAARPASALSQYSTGAAAYAQPTPSMVNAQACYPQQQAQLQQQPGHLAQPPSIPPRSSSPGATPGFTPIPSPYSQTAQQSQQHQSHVSRPLPSIQSSTSLASATPSQQQHAHPSHLYQPAQQPSPPPPMPSHQPQLSDSHSHSLTHSYSQNGWQGVSPPSSQPGQPSYVAAAPNGNATMSSSLSSGYPYSPPPPPSSTASGNDGTASWMPGRSPSPLPPIPGSFPKQQPLPPPTQNMSSSGSMHNFYGTSATPAPAPEPTPPIINPSFHQGPAPPAPQHQVYQQQYNASQGQQHHYTAHSQSQPSPLNVASGGYGHQYQQPSQSQQYSGVSQQQAYHQQPPQGGGGGGISSSQTFSSSLLYQSHQNNQYQHSHSHAYAHLQQQQQQPQTQHHQQ
ncbi:related to calcineurin temperature suppressor cts1 [Melanopsichium pennsylvanicum]|uniref:Related to calcineurin temperature suppressor cts1 n=2 Tax=Melanopsichium pennsylvanicum TaxID=63383 RepID=A0AAJ5C8W6_9BASI|nr:related to calcineurin temperature suppressor cts1 [Melanopsichium pennsylvanicum]